MYFELVESREQVNVFAPLVAPVTLIVNSPNGLVSTVVESIVKAVLPVSCKTKLFKPEYDPLDLKIATAISP
jgi:hypothetical protein